MYIKLPVVYPVKLPCLVEIFLFQVMSVKAIGIALKLTLSGMNQLVFPQTWAFTFIVLLCIITQMNYLNKVMNDSPFLLPEFVVYLIILSFLEGIL